MIEWLARQPGESRVTDVARALGLARSNAHRTLQTLVACGWAVQNPASSAYRPSLRLFELGSQLGASADLIALVRPHLAALAASTGETIHLARLDGAEIVYLDKFDSPLPVAAYSRIGGRAPACCVASGKALLAAALPSIADLRALFGSLKAHTPNSITDFAALRSELERTAVRGYAEQKGAKLGAVAQPLRAALTGRTTSPGIFNVLAVLGRQESLARLRDQAAAA